MSNRPFFKKPQVSKKPQAKSRRQVLRRGLAATAVLGLAPLALAPALAKPALAREKSFHWKLVTTWPKDAPGPGTTAARLAAQLTSLSGGRLTVTLYAAGELVPALEVFDAVASGGAELGHSASLFWAGKHPLTPLFTAVPFGLMPEAQQAWLNHGGGQALWDELYAPFGIKPFAAGNSGVQMGGWYKKRLTDLSDVQGLRVRMPGWGGEIVRRLGATPVTLPPGEIFQALASGVIDAAEYLGPWSDRAFGFHRVAPYYYWPGFHKPNGTAELLVNKAAYEELPADLQDLVVMVAASENARGLAEADWNNAASLQLLEAEPGLTILSFPREIIAAARKASQALRAQIAAHDALSQRLLASYEAAEKKLFAWNRIARKALMELEEL